MAAAGCDRGGGRELDRPRWAAYLAGMFVVAPSTMLNPAALETRRIPKKLLGRVAILPRRGLTPGLVARLVLEGQFLRFSVALAPFVIAMLIWPEAALPISQAPLAMLLVIGVVEMRLLRIVKDKRPAVCDESQAARVLDALRFRATRLLSRIAAGRGLPEGVLHLVVEQSELARVPPLTLVSVQWDGPRRVVLDLTDGERALLQAELFGDEVSEAALAAANQREAVFLRDIALPVHAVSAHARLAAIAAARAEVAPATEARA